MPFNIKSGVSFFRPILLQSDEIDAKVVGAISLGKNFSNKIFVPFWGGVAIKQRSGTGTAPTISLGTNASAYDNIAQAAALTALLQGNVAPVQFRAQYPYSLPDAESFVNVSVAATYTTYVIQISIMGYLV